MFTSSTTESPDPILNKETNTDLMTPMCDKDPSSNVGLLSGIALTATTTTLNSMEDSVQDGVNRTLTRQPGATIISPVLLGLAGITGHVCALCYLYSSSRRHSARTVFYVLLCWLIWTDFVGKIMVTPAPIMAYAFGGWIGGRPMCQYHGFSMVLICMVTHFTVAAMAIERFLGICHGYFYSRNVTPSRCRMLLIGIWVGCVSFSLLPLFDVGQFFLQYPGTWCFTNLHLCSWTKMRHRLYTTTLGVLNTANLLIIVVCNILVVGSLLRMRVSRHLPSHQPQHPRRSMKQNERELQMVILLVLITCVFVISWAPLDMILITNQFWDPHVRKEDHINELTAVRLASINQIVDPWAYIICRVAFRSRLWKCCRLAFIGRVGSRREGFKLSLLQGRKFSRSNAAPKDNFASDKRESVDQANERDYRPPTAKSKAASANHKSYYSDSGTGSYSGTEPQLGEGNEGQIMSLELLQQGEALRGTDGQVLSPHLLQQQRQHTRASALQQSLVKSLSVAIPIPLFTSEQYRVGSCSHDHKGYDRCCFLDVPHNCNNARAQALQRCNSSASAQGQTGSPLISINGCNDAGVIRSHSWGCHDARSCHPPQYRTQSTQTLVCPAYTIDQGKHHLQDPQTRNENTLHPFDIRYPQELPSGVKYTSLASDGTELEPESKDLLETDMCNYTSRCLQSQGLADSQYHSHDGLQEPDSSTPLLRPDKDTLEEGDLLERNVDSSEEFEPSLAVIVDDELSEDSNGRRTSRSRV